MPEFPARFRMTGATILRDGALVNRPVTVDQGRIRGGKAASAQTPEIDLSGFWILPGIVDLNGGPLPRARDATPESAAPLAAAIDQADRTAATMGVTTRWFTQRWSWEGGLAGPERAEKVVAAWAAHKPFARTDLRLQLRCETHSSDSAERLAAIIDAYSVDYVIFSNRVEAILARALAHPRALQDWADEVRVQPAQLLKAIEAARGRAPEVPRHLCRLAERFDQRGVSYGSFQDPDGDTRERFSMIGARICETPRAQSAALVARAVGDPVLLDARHLTKAATAGAGFSAMTLLRHGLGDAVLSGDGGDLAQVAFGLVDRGVRALPEAWALISSQPAAALGLYDRGWIADQARADLAIVNRRTRHVEATIGQGRVIYTSGAAARRFSQAGLTSFVATAS